MIDENAYHGGGHGDRLLRTQQQPAVGSQLPVSRDTAKQHSKIHASRDTATLANLRCDKADVVGIGDYAYSASTIEGDIELARQPVEVTRVQNVVMESVGYGVESISSFGSMPDKGDAVMLRILSAPEPRDVSPRACTLVKTRTISLGWNSRICKFARVVMSARPDPHCSAIEARPRIW